MADADLQKYASLAQIIQAILSVVIGGATVVVLFLTLYFNKRSQADSHALAKQSMMAHVLGEFNARFSRIWELRANPDIKSDPILYYDHFWSLQFDQFDAWRRGTVPDDTFFYWAHSRHVDWVADKELGTMKYQEGFRKTVVDKWQKTEFTRFMEILHAQGARDALDAFKNKRTP